MAHAFFTGEIARKRYWGEESDEDEILGFVVVRE
jgi:hypothetical protein